MLVADLKAISPVGVVVEPVANLLLDDAEPRAARGVPLVLGAATRRQELLRGGHAHLRWRARVAEADCWLEEERCEEVAAGDTTAASQPIY